MLAISVVLASFPAKAQEAEPMTLQESKIKAGLVYNFLKYTHWSDFNITNSKQLEICLLGGDPFEGALYPLDGRTAQQYTIKISQPPSVTETSNCSLVIIHRSQENNLAQILQALKGKNIMTLSDIGQFSRKGGMVELSMQDQRIHLYINQQAVSSSGLQIDDRLLKLAERGH